MRRRVLLLFVVLFCASLLCACGGGGSGDTTVSTAVPSETTGDASIGVAVGADSTGPVAEGHLTVNETAKDAKSIADVESYDIGCKVTGWVLKCRWNVDYEPTDQ